MVLGTLIVILFILVVVFVAGNQLLSFVNNSSSALSELLGDAQIAIPKPKIGSTVCDLFVTASWREKTTNSVFEVSTILFTNTEGKTISASSSNCHKLETNPLSLMSLVDYAYSSKTSMPLELIIPQQSAFSSKYSMSFVLIDENGFEKKVPHYQNLDYVVPALTFTYDYEKKLVFRDLEAGTYTLELRPSNAKWNDHGESQPYKQTITVG